MYIVYIFSYEYLTAYFHPFWNNLKSQERESTWLNPRFRNYNDGSISI